MPGALQGQEVKFKIKQMRSYTLQQEPPSLGITEHQGSKQEANDPQLKPCSAATLTPPFILCIYLYTYVHKTSVCVYIYIHICFSYLLYVCTYTYTLYMYIRVCMAHNVQTKAHASNPSQLLTDTQKKESTQIGLSHTPTSLGITDCIVNTWALTGLLYRDFGL